MLFMEDVMHQAKERENKPDPVVWKGLLDDRATLKELFAKTKDKLDTDQDGFVSREELENARRRQDLNQTQTKLVELMRSHYQFLESPDGVSYGKPGLREQNLALLDYALKNGPESRLTGMMLAQGAQLGMAGLWGGIAVGILTRRISPVFIGMGIGTGLGLVSGYYDYHHHYKPEYDRIAKELGR